MSSRGGTLLQSGAWILVMAGLWSRVAAGQTPGAQIQELYKSKCQICHGEDGSGTMAGNRFGTHDFHSADVLQQSDSQLTAIIAQGKNKMPPYEKKLTEEEIKALVAYCRALGQKKQ